MTSAANATAASVNTNMIVARALSAGVAVARPTGIDLHRYRLARRARRQERRDHEVVDRTGEHHHHAGEDRRTEQWQQHQSHGLQAVGAEVAGSFLVLRPDRRQSTADDHDDVRDAERDVARAAAS